MLEFEWDKDKENANIEKHGVSFYEAQLAFEDPDRLIEFDSTHSVSEERFHCYGYVNGDIMTVRFTCRNDTIRIFGAAYWRKGKRLYEKNQENT